VNSIRHTEVGDYVSRLRHELADLPPDEVDEIIEDLEPQLAELVEELGAEPTAVTLEDRLGTPGEYARELRTAAGFGPATARRPSVVPRTALWVLVVCTVAAGYGGHLHAILVSNDARYVLPLFGVALALTWIAVGRGRPAVREVAALPEVRFAASLVSDSVFGRQVVGYLTSLRPAWFLVRAGLVWLSCTWLFREFGWWDAWPETAAAGAAVLTLVAGYRSVADRRWLWLSVPLGAWATGAALSVLNYGELWGPLLAGDYVGF
jgi:hypothetical protein